MIKRLQNGRYYGENIYDLSNEYGIGYTSNTKEPFYFDLEDYDKIKEYCWSANRRKENNHIDITTKYKNKTLYIHRVILNINDRSIAIDHINRNTFDNRKENLRLCNNKLNVKNQSKPRNSKCEFMGVSFEKGKYVARIGYNNRKIHLGRYSNLEDAIIVRLKAEKEYFGDYAPQKDLFKRYGII